MSLSAGAAVRDITPPGPAFLVGYPHVPRTSVGVHDPLQATALWLEDGSTALVLVAVDLLFVHHDTVEDCRAAIRDATGVPATNILISATHTHSGPVTSSMLAWSDDPVVPAPDPAYMAHLRTQIVRAALEAAANRVQAEMAATKTLVGGVGGNRISSTGVADPEAAILFLRDAADHWPISLDLVYAMHPTVLHEDSLLVSGDFPAFARKAIEEVYTGIRVLYHSGPCGNQSPRRHAREQTFREAERLGRVLGQQVTSAVAALRASDFRARAAMGSAMRNVELPARTFPPLPVAEENLRAARLRFDALRREGADRADVRTAECTVFGAEELVVLARSADGSEGERVRQAYALAEVQVFRVADAFVVGLPGELFVEYGLAIKRASPRLTSVISLANGELQGYIVTPEAEAAGGYEAACSFFAPQAGELLVDTALDLIRELAP